MVLLACSLLLRHALGDNYQTNSKPLIVSVLSGPAASEHEGNFGSHQGKTSRKIIPESDPTWIRITGIQRFGAETTLLLLDGLQVTRGQLWLFAPDQAGNPQLLSASPIEFNRTDLGSVASLPDLPEGQEVLALANITPRMPRIVEARLIETYSHANASRQFQRYGGTLAGIFLALAAFSTVIGLIARESTFVLFAGWLVTSFRLAAVNAGYDLEWLASIDPSTTLGQLLLKATFAIHGLLTLALFERLFRGAIGSLLSHSLTTLNLAFGTLLLLSPFLPHTKFFQISWVIASLALLAQVLGVAGAFQTARRNDMRLPRLAWIVNIAGSLLQIAVASGSFPRTIPLLNSQTAAYASGFLIAIALADRLRLERSARVSAQRQAVTALAKFRETYTHVPIGLFTLTAQGVFIRANPSFLDMFGDGTHRPALPIRWNEILDEQGKSRLVTAIQGKDRAEVELQSVDCTRWFRLHVHYSHSRIEGSIEDITQRRQARLTRQRLADHDHLTDLLNRRGFDELFRQQNAQPGDVVRGHLAFIDLDRFKLINDMFGAAIGDEVLRQVAARLRTATPSGTACARIGGDEFVVLSAEADFSNAYHACNALLDALNTQSYAVRDKQFSVIASIGLIQLKTGMPPNLALSAAERACSEAKQHGGNRIVAYEERSVELEKHALEMEMVSTIHNALPTEIMRIVLQPIISLRNPFQHLNYETLLRVVDANGHLTGPATLIQAAERHGFASRLDRWVLDSMMDWLNANPEHRDRLDYCAINLSGASLNDERFLADVLSIVRDNPQTARKICFEITETVALYDLRNTCRFVDHVRSEGSKVALDDFGAGYTSFNYLKSLRANVVKIDGAFIMSLDSAPANYAITKTIASLAHEMNMSCVAEWVESASIARILLEMGIEFGQGWALSKPISRESMQHVRSGGELLSDAAVVDALGLRIAHSERLLTNTLLV